MENTGVLIHAALWSIRNVRFPSTNPLRGRERAERERSTIADLGEEARDLTMEFPGRPRAGWREAPVLCWSQSRPFTLRLPDGHYLVKEDVDHSTADM